MNTSLLPFLILSHTAFLAGDTNFVRQMAKDKSSIYVLTAGPASQELAERLLSDIKQHRDWNSPRGKHLDSMSFEQFGAILSKQPDVSRESIIAFVCQNEKPVIPSEVSRILHLKSISSAIETSTLNPSDSHISAKWNRPAKEGLSFLVSLEAPDGPRASKLFEIFERTAAKRWEDLKYEDTFHSNKVAVHTQLGSEIKTWGQVGGKTWNSIDLFPFGENPPESLKDSETVSAYLIDRSRSSDGLPDSIRNAMASLGAHDNSLVAFKQTLNGGATIAALSAPNARLLQTITSKYPNVNSLPSNPWMSDVVDLRRIGRSTLIVQPGELPQNLIETVRANLAANMRSNGIEILERGATLGELSKEVTLEQLTGATSTVKSLRSKGLRYVWHLSVLELRGRTKFDGTSSRDSSVPATWDRTRPEKPDRHANENDQKRGEAIRQWNDDCRKYDEEYEYWRYRVPVEFTQSITKTVSANCSISLKLFDLQDDLGKVVWEMNQDGTYSETTDYHREKVTVHGAENQPPRFEVPASNDTCGSTYMTGAIKEASNKALISLVSNAWLSGDPYGAPLPKETDIQVGESTRTPVPVPTKAIVGKVITYAGGILVISLGQSEGLKVGDTVTLLVNNKLVKLTVTTVSDNSVCSPVSQSDKKLLALVKPGSLVKWTKGK